MNYLLVDCFDTVFHREEANESTLFAWAREVKNVYSLQLPVNDIYNLRKRTENKLKNFSSKEDITYKEMIYDIYLSLGCLECDAEEFLKSSYDIDLQIEKELLSLDLDNLHYVKTKKKEGYVVALVSDFYMSKRFFEDILECFEIRELFSDIFVSSEIGLRKDSGNLYAYVLDYYKCTEKDYIIMMGDNEKSDIIEAQKKGINTRHVEYHNNTVYFPQMKNLKNKLKNCLEVTSMDNLLLGYISASMLFCDRLYHSAKKNDCEILLFCSREGQLLKRLFDIYQEKMHCLKKIRTEYMYVSRRSTLLPSLKDYSSEEFERIFRQYKEITIYDMLFSIGLDKAEINNLITEEQKMYRIHNAEELKEVLATTCINELYEKKQLEQKKLFKEYVKQLAGDTNQIHLVDIGWKGTIQDNIYNALDGEYSIKGYYFGLYNYSDSVESSKEGLLFDLTKNNPDNMVYAYNHLKLESVFLADHGSVLNYQSVNGVIEPNVDVNDDLKAYLYIKNYQEIFVEGFSNAISCLFNSPFDVKDMEKMLTKSYLYFQCVKVPKYRQVFDRLKADVKENFGNLSKIETLIREANADIHEIQNRDFGYVYGVYRILRKFGLKWMFPLADLYCRCIYFMKRISLLR